ncbi:MULTISPECIES: nuclear transport factor 2-like protein [Amycolatopsis]|uniref:SnoaL-like domain-containing protein n=1 Tax=Amycolatopsis albidoflavus TaxID=102226 RepID=A0ABW5IB75_9PSEU
MTTETRRTVRAYHEARFRGDVPAAAAQIGEKFSFRSPFIASESPTGHLDGIDGMLSIVTGVEMISELYSDTEATLVYDVRTASPVGTQRTAEHFRLADGRITSILLIFDATPWQAVMAAAGPV